MSSRTPTECVALATDASASEADRTAAIRELKRANECDELEALVRTDDLDERIRHEALRALATRQCRSTLRELVEEGALDQDRRDEAADLLADVDGS